MTINSPEYLEKFDHLLGELPATISVEALGKDAYALTPSRTVKPAPTIALVGLTHGDEVIGLHLFIDLLKQLMNGCIELKGTLTLILANRDAYLAGRRYVETDLNRCYGNDDQSTLEGRRSIQIKSAITGSDVIIDLHQCIEKTLHPFFILPYSVQSYRWINEVAPTLPIIKREHITQASTLSTYGYLNGKKAVTFEVGDYGFDDEQRRFGLEVINAFLRHAWDGIKASNKTDNPMYVIRHHEPYPGGKVRFAKSFVHFEWVEKDETIVYLNETPVVAPMAGKLLLYPQHWFNKESNIQAEGLFAIIDVSR